jgi:uncharacterized membrane protein YphA (DoxX/SURF4 family)
MTTITLLQLLVSAFLAVLFLQSGVDKITDRAGNLEWLQGHFANSPLAGFVTAMVGIITVVEVVAGTFCALGVVTLLLGAGPTVAWFGAVASAAALLMLFFGQRMAKEYEGAAVLVPYFLVSLAAIYICSS